MLAAAVVSCVVGAAGAQTILRVKANAFGVHDGASWTSAYATLQSALDAATPGTEIWVASGAYVGIGTGIAALSTRSNVGVYGGFSGNEFQRSQRDPAANVATLWGNGRSTVLFDNVTGAVLDGFKVNQGSGKGSLSTPFGTDGRCPGGGIHVNAATRP